MFIGNINQWQQHLKDGWVWWMRHAHTFYVFLFVGAMAGCIFLWYDLFWRSVWTEEQRLEYASTQKAVVMTDKHLESFRAAMTRWQSQEDVHSARDPFSYSPPRNEEKSLDTLSGDVDVSGNTEANTVERDVSSPQTTPPVRDDGVIPATPSSAPGVDF